VESPATDHVASGVARFALRTPTLPPATHTNSYLVGDGDFYLVEPASPFDDERARLTATLRSRVARGDRFLGAILTHHHGDHTGAAEHVHETFGVPLRAHARTRDNLRGAVTIDRPLAEGDRLAGLEALDVELLHTPGHAPGHLCLRSCAHGWMIVGDMVASVGTILIDPSDDGDMDEYLAQLARLAELRPTRLLPAHGDPIDDAVARLEFYVRHRLAREAKVLAAVKASPTTLDAVVTEAYEDTPQAAFPLAERSARAHLARLEKHGQVERCVTDGADERWCLEKGTRQ